MNNRCALLGILISSCCWGAVSGAWGEDVAQPSADSAKAVAGTAATGQLQFRVVIVDELTPKPVPFTDFVVTAQTGDRARLPVRTDEQGNISVALAPGQYQIENETPVNYAGRPYTWINQFTVTAGGVTKITVTNSDAKQPGSSTVNGSTGILQGGGAVVAPKPVLARVFHPDGLNPAFVLTGEQVREAAEKGKEAADKGVAWQDLFGNYADLPRGVKGEKGRSHESRVVCAALDGYGIVYSAFNAARKYEKFMIPEDVQTNGTYDRTLPFLLYLKSEPKHMKTIPLFGGLPVGRNRRAVAEDVEVEKFVLTDDNGTVYQPLEEETQGTHTGMVTFSGIDVLPHLDTSHTTASASGSSFGTANVRAHGPGGYATANGSYSAYGSASGSSTTTYQYDEYIPWSEQHPYYERIYQVTFPLFDQDGIPLFKSDTRKLVLHIVTGKGEMSVEYVLRPPNLPSASTAKVRPVGSTSRRDHTDQPKAIQPAVTPQAVSTPVAPAAPPTKTAPPIAPAKIVSAPLPPAQLAIKGIPCKVRIETKDGNSLIGRATKFENDIYTIETHHGSVTVNAGDLKTVEYPAE